MATWLLETLPAAGQPRHPLHRDRQTAQLRHPGGTGLRFYGHRLALYRLPAHCGALARPNVLMFNDGSWLEARAEAQYARLGPWRARVRPPVVIELGAGTDITSVRRWCESLDAPLPRINPHHSASFRMSRGSRPDKVSASRPARSRRCTACAMRWAELGGAEMLEPRSS